MENTNDVVRVGQYSFTRDEWTKILHKAHDGLLANPHDEHAKEAIRMAGQALGQSPPDEAQAAAGEGSPESTLSQIPSVIKGVAKGVAYDIPLGAAHLAAHPIQSLGQMTGFGNAAHADSVFHDPEAGWEERLDAALRATPLNMGYAPMRALTEATGSGGLFTPERSTEPRDNTENIARKATNVASIPALMMLSGGSDTPPKTPEGFSRFGGNEPPVMGPREVGPITPEVEPMPKPGPKAPVTPQDANWSIAPEEVAPQQPQLALPKPKAPVTEVPPDLGRVQGQKGVTFGDESPLSPAIQAQVKQLLGEISRNQPGPESIEPIPGANGFNTGTNYGRSAIGGDTPPARGPTFWDQVNGEPIRDVLARARSKMDQHTPESIQGTDMLKPGTGDITLGPNKGPDVPMGDEAGFLGGRMGEAATIMFSPRLYLLLRRLGKTPEDLVGVSHTNAAIKAIVQDLSTASLLGQDERVKQDEDAIERALKNGPIAQR